MKNQLASPFVLTIGLFSSLSIAHLTFGQEASGAVSGLQLVASTTVAIEPAPQQTASAPAAPAATAAAPSASAGASTGDDGPVIRKIEGPAAEPVDLADLAGPALLKRIGPAIAVILLILLLLRRRR